jgi:hypothetical protein
MAITINGTGSITGLTAGGLPDGSVTAADIETSLDLTGKTVTLPSGTGGKILQVQTAVKSNTSSVTGYNWTDTGLSVSITPTSTNSKVLVLADMNIGGTNVYDIKLRLLRNTTAIGLGDAVGSRPRVTRVTATYPPDSFGGYHQVPTSIIYLDSPSTTSATTYKIQFATYDTQVGYLNRSADNAADADNEYQGTPASFITVMEVAG